VRQRAAAGFSLLELLVAISILAVSLGALYQAASGATRNVRIDRDTLYATELARSLVAEYAVVDVLGVSAAGETSGGFRWRARSQPLQEPLPESLAPGALQRLEIRVAWDDGRRERTVDLVTVVPGIESW